MEQSFPGRRAVFLVELRTPQEARRLTQLFDTIGELADVEQLASGRVCVYAVRAGSDETELFNKIEAVLKSKFFFSLIERRFDAAAYRLVSRICEEAGGDLRDIARCAVCAEADPFPTRVLLFDGEERSLGAADFCTACTARLADPDPLRHAANLLTRARGRFSGLPPVSLIEELERSEGVAGADASDETWVGNQRIIAIAV